MKNIFSENVEKMISSSSPSIRLMLEDPFDVIDKEAKEKEEAEKREEEASTVDDSASSDFPQAVDEPAPDISDEPENQLDSSTDNMSPTEKIKALEDQFTKSLSKINSRLDDDEKPEAPARSVTNILSVGLSGLSESKKLKLSDVLNEKKSLEDKIEKLKSHVSQLDDINDELEKKTKKLPLSFENKEVFIENIKTLAEEYMSGRLDVTEILRGQIGLQIDSLFEGETGYDLEDFKKECEMVFNRHVGLEDNSISPTHIEAVGAISSGA